LVVAGAPVVDGAADAAARALGGRAIDGVGPGATVTRSARVVLVSLPASLTDAAASRFASDLVGGDAASADRLVVSIGSVADGLDGLLGSVQEATDLSRGARPRGVRAAVLRRADERPLMRLVTSLRDDHRLLRHSERMLQPLIEYDLARDGDLLHVLGAVVAHPGIRSAAAAASHLSRSVFYQRLALIGDLLGADLDDGETLTGLHLALLVRRSAAS
jgi:purine catabolism regulator